jgi:hypothetical protein
VCHCDRGVTMQSITYGWNVRFSMAHLEEPKWLKNIDLFDFAR